MDTATRLGYGCDAAAHLVFDHRKRIDSYKVFFNLSFVLANNLYALKKRGIMGKIFKVLWQEHPCF